MAPRSYPTDVLAQVTEILAACKQIGPDLQAGQLTQAALSEALTDARHCQSDIAALEMQLSALRNKRDERLTQLWDAVKRVRATVKGTFGDDSPEYELMGGTRISERKRPTRRPPA